MDLSEALAYLDRHLNREARAGRIEGLSLDNMVRLMDVLGEPQRAYPVIHVTGTNGKGSVARMITALLTASGLQVGTYTSPHLDRLNERLARDGEPIDDDELAAVITEVAELEPLADVDASWFELVTAAALSWFAQVAVDVAVVEVGLLGRFDATNVVDAEVAVVTNVGLDHTDGVGDWRQAVAGEKAGIVKPGSFLVLGIIDEDLRPLFAAEGPRQIWQADVDFAVEEDLPAVGGRVVDLRTPNGVLEEVFLPVHGRHQATNAAVAVAAVEAFFGRALDERIVEEAFATLTLPARLEVMGRQPLVVVDGAHNPPAAAVVAEGLADSFEVAGRRILVLGMLDGRDPAAFLAALGVAQFDVVITCTPDSPRALSGVALAAAVTAAGVEAEVAPTVGDAIDRALAAATEDDLILVTGSLYLAGPARVALQARLGTRQRPTPDAPSAVDPADLAALTRAAYHAYDAPPTDDGEVDELDDFDDEDDPDGTWVDDLHRRQPDVGGDRGELGGD